MNKSKRLLTSTILLITAALGAGFVGPAKAQPRKIGLSLPLGSNFAKLTEQFVIGANLALKNLSDPGKYELFIVDDGCNREIGSLAADDLLTAKVVFAFGYFCSEAAEIAAETLKKSGIPILVTGARSARLIKDRRKEAWNLWRMSPGDDYPAEAAFRALSNRWRNVPYALVDDGTIYGRAQVDEFRARMEEAGFPPHYVDNFRAAQSTQAGLIRRLQRSGVKAAYIGASADDLSLISRNIKQLGSDFEIVGGEVMNVLPYLTEEEPVPEGLLAIIEPEPDQLVGTKAIRTQLEKEGIETEPYVFKGYAGMQVILQALQNHPENTSEVLENTTFETILGPVDFNQDGQNIINLFSLYVWMGGKFVPIQNSEANN